MKKITLVIVLLAALQAHSQTKKIAHRSHSGNNASFNVESEDDFGIVRRHQEEIKDTTVKKKPVAAKDSIPAKKTCAAKICKNAPGYYPKNKIKGRLNSSRLHI